MLTLEKLMLENPELKVVGYNDVQTPVEAAALILSYFESERERKDFLVRPSMQRGSDDNTYALRNDGRSIGQIAGLFENKHKRELAWAGLDMVMQSISDPTALELEDAAYLMAVAFPASERQGASATKVFLAYAEKLMDSGTLPKLDPVALDMRDLPLDAMFVQTTCLFVHEHLCDRTMPKDDDLTVRAIGLAQRFLKYCPHDDNHALYILNRNASDEQVLTSVPDIQAAWLNSAKRSAGSAFLEDGVTIAPRWEFIREKFNDPKNKDQFIAAALSKEGKLHRWHPRLSPGGGLVPAVEYKPG